MKKYSDSSRRYSDCSPKSPCDSSQGMGKRFGGGVIGHVVSDFDHYGYPIVQNFRLPEPFHLVENDSGRGRFASIVPMKFSDEDSVLKPGLARVHVFRLKPSPTVPAASAGLSTEFEFCVQKGRCGHFLRFRNPKASLHGAEVRLIHCDHVDGITLCTVIIPGSDRSLVGPLCEDEPWSDKESLESECCVRVLGNESGQIVCPGSSYDLLLVKIVSLTVLGGIGIASIEHPDLPGGGARLPVCEPVDEDPLERPCCIEDATGLIVCPEGVNFPLNGKRIPLQYLEFISGPEGERLARLRCGDIRNSPRSDDPNLKAMIQICVELGGYIFPVCSRTKSATKGRAKKPIFSDLCCFDSMSGMLVCEGSMYHGLKVEVVNEFNLDGIRMVSVFHDEIPGGEIRVPLCVSKFTSADLSPENCCIVESGSELIVSCDPNHPWNGRNVTEIGDCAQTPDGKFCVLSWTDESGSQRVLELPICRQSGGDSEYISKMWDLMVSAPAKLTKCDKKWLNVTNHLKSMSEHSGLGRRFSSIPIGRARKYGMGIAAEFRKYARYPGLRGRVSE